LTEQLLARLHKENEKSYIKHLSDKISRASKGLAKDVKNSANGGDVVQNVDTSFIYLLSISFYNVFVSVDQLSAYLANSRTGSTNFGLN
jgi:hypothetical protein